MKQARKRIDPSRSHSKHGITKLKAAVKQLGGRALDGRTTLAKELLKWKGEIIRDLGGDESVSAQAKATLDVAVRTKMILDSADAWLLTQRTLINARNRALLPIVRERQQIADSLVKMMVQLGLKRQARQVPSLKSQELSGGEGEGSSAVTIIEAVTDPQLFGPLFPEETWTPWHCALSALYGLPMGEEDLVSFAAPARGVKGLLQRRARRPGS